MKRPIRQHDWPRLLVLVEQALDLPAADREAWLRGLGLDESLATSLQALLEQRRAIETGGFLATLPALGGAVSREAAPLLGGLHAGDLLGPWRLLRELGQGGMSVVWLAARADGQVARQVALKLPHAGPGQDQLARRMLRERRILAALEHPNIARLYDVGLTCSGTPYLVMEYVQGDNLLAYADAQCLNIRQRLDLFQQVLRAVQYAHGKLVLHRDLKPGNILVSAQGEVKLLDFGIAKMLVDDTDPAAETALTGTMGRRMTPGYASPEQLAGQSLGTASDVYSLGVLLYELLSGQRPHARTGHSLAQLEADALSDEVRPPSRLRIDPAALRARATNAAALVRTLRGDLDAIAVHALAPTAERRYATVDALATDLVAWLGGQPVAARAPGAWYLFSKFVRRHRMATGLGSAAVVALLAASAVAIVQGQAAQQQATRAAAARDFMLQLFDEAAPHRIGGVQLSAMQLLEQGRRNASERLADQPLLQAELLAGVGETQYLAGDREGADVALSQAAALFRQAGDATQEASARISRFKVHLEEVNYATVDQLKRDLVPLMSVILKDRRLYVRWLNAEARYARMTRNAPEEQQRFKQSIAAADMSDPWQAEMAFDSHLGLAGMLLFLQGDLKASQAELDAATAVPTSARHLTETHKRFRLTEARIERDFYLQRGVEIAAWLPAAITSCERASGRDDTRCQQLKGYWLTTLNYFGPSTQAVALVRDLERSLDSMPSLDARFRMALQQTKALAMSGLTDPQEKATRVLTALLSSGQSARLPVAKQMPGLVLMGQVHLRAGDFAGARQWFARAEERLDVAGGERRRAQIRLRYARGLLAQAEGDHREALELMGPHCSATDRWISSTLFNLNCIRSLAATDQMPAALALARAAVPRLTEGIGPDAPNTIAARQLLSELEAPRGARSPPWNAGQVFFID